MKLTDVGLVILRKIRKYWYNTFFEKLLRSLSPEDRDRLISRHTELCNLGKTEDYGYMSMIVSGATKPFCICVHVKNLHRSIEEVTITGVNLFEKINWQYSYIQTKSSSFDIYKEISAVISSMLKRFC